MQEAEKYIFKRKEQWMPGARVQPAELKVQFSKLKILHVSNFQFLQEWSYHNLHVKNVYDTYKCENFVSQSCISWTLQQ